MATEKVILEIAAQTADAQKKLSRFGTEATKTMRGVEKSLSGVKILAAGVAGFFAGRALISNLKEITQAASIQEDAVNALNTSLKTSGEFSNAASIEMQKYAGEMQKTSIYGDELILNQLALAKAFGATNNQAKEVVTAATELAAATGKSLDEATRQVSKTLGGFAGELGEVNPKIKALTAEQLKAGDAAKILIDQYSGSALSKISTYSGAQTQLSNTIGDLKEELGFLITQNPIVINGIKSLTKFFSGMIDVVNKNRDAVTDLVSKGFKALLGTIPSFFTFGQILVATFDAINDSINMVYQAAVELAKFLVNVYNAATFNPLIKLRELLTGEELPNGARDLARELDKISQAISEEIDDNSYLQNIANILEDGKIEAQKLVDTIDKLPDTKTVNLDINTQVNGTSKAVSGIQKDIQSLIPINFGVEGPGIDRTGSADMFPKEGPKEATYFEKAGGYIANSFSTAMKDMKVGEIIGKGLQMVLSGKQGAISAVSAIGDALLPGIGGAISQLAQLGPEGAKAMIKEFATSLPEIVVTVVEALAASADVIVESLIDSLLIRGGLERIVVALIQAIPRVAYKLVESTIRGLNNGIVALSERFGLGITRAMHTPQWVEQLREYVRGLTKTPEWMRKFQFEMPNWMKRLEELFNWLPNAIKKATTIGGSGGSTYNVVNQVFGSGTTEDIFGYRKGGLVYAANGFVPRGTDTVPAMLTPGERVLTVQQNQSFEQLPMILAQLVSVLSSPMTTETSIEIDGNRLADVILQLNRRNARVA